MIFDLDGTLADTLPDIQAAANQLLAEHGCEPLGMDEVRRCVGNGAGALVERILPAKGETLVAAKQRYLALYAQFQTHSVSLYPGALEALALFRENSLPMAVLTNKPQAAADAVIDHLGIRRYFSHCTGGGAGLPLKPDPAGFIRIVEDWDVPRDAVLMVGDSDVDIKTAGNAGAHCAFFTDRYGREGADRATFAISSFTELVSILFPERQ